MKEPVAPTRSQSVGSLMELQTPAERRIKDLITDESKASPKRKLETAISTDQANLARDGKKKDKIVKENTVADISVCSSPLDRSRTQTLTKDMEVEASNQPEVADPQLEGAACAEILEAAKKRSVAKVKTGTNLSAQVLDDINENPSQENLSGDVDKENLVEKKVEKKAEKESESKATPTKKKVVKKVLGAKSDNVKKEEAAPLVSLQTVLQKVYFSLKFPTIIFNILTIPQFPLSYNLRFNTKMLSRTSRPRRVTKKKRPPQLFQPANLREQNRRKNRPRNRSSAVDRAYSSRRRSSRT